MKHIIKQASMAILCILMLVGAAQAANITPSASQITLTKNQSTFTIDISLTQAAPFAGAEFGIDLPEGVSVRQVTFLDNAIQSASKSPQLLKGNRYYFGFYDTKNSFQGSYAVARLTFFYSGSKDISIPLGYSKIVTVLGEGITAGDTSSTSFAIRVTRETGNQGDTGGGGGGGTSKPSTSTEITVNPDGSITETVTRPDGSTTETTTSADGSTQVVDTAADGTIITTTTDVNGNKTSTVDNTDGSSETTVTNIDGSASITTVSAQGQVAVQVTLSEAVVSGAAQSGETVPLPMPQVPVTTDRTTAPTVTVELPANTSTKVEIPVENVTSGTVAVIIHDDGTEEVIKTTVTTENGIVATIKAGETIKIVDNAATFTDVDDSHWGADSVDFTSSRELFQGTSSTTFSPATNMSRAMVVTVLARLDGVDTDTGAAWYEAGSNWAMGAGISDGTNMDGIVTREQIAVMLYRYVGQPIVSTSSMSGYTDAVFVSDWAVPAMAWAVSQGIITGNSATTLSPMGEASRVEVATMLMRFYNLLV